MKSIPVVLIIFLSFSASAQKYITKTGVTEFKASVEAFEPVEAKNNSTTAVLNASTGEIAALLFIKAFHFNVALMEEHFNENYMDSDEHPKATFRGKIDDFYLGQLGSETQTFKASGELTIKGKSKTINTFVKLKKEAGNILVASKFTVQPSDFNIEIPSIVKDKISETINIRFQYELVKKN